MTEHEIFDNIPKESAIFITNWFYISERINKELVRAGRSDVELAEYLGITPRKLRTYLDCPYNFNLKTLAKIEAFIGKPILTIKDSDDE